MEHFCIAFHTSFHFITTFYLVSVIWKMLYPAMYDAKRVKLCFPDPPTPTSRALPLSVRMTLEI